MHMYSFNIIFISKNKDKVIHVSFSYLSARKNVVTL